MRHPRTIVGTDGKRVMWAVIDGRDNMHSVGATIEETRKVCKWLGMTTALNLDGGDQLSMVEREYFLTAKQQQRCGTSHTLLRPDLPGGFRRKTMTKLSLIRHIDKRDPA